MIHLQKRKNLKLGQKKRLDAWNTIKQALPEMAQFMIDIKQKMANQRLSK
jgi:hypothetical protein